MCEDLHKICGIMRLIQDEIMEEQAAYFILELRMMESPKVLAENLVDTVFFGEV